MRILDFNEDREEITRLLSRSSEVNRSVEEAVRRILDEVRRDGDSAVLAYTRQFDYADIDRIGLVVSNEEIRRAFDAVSKEFLHALRIAKKNVTAFHRRQLPKSWTLRRPGVSLEQRFRALDRVGIYIPGGKGAYLSTVVMNALPATVAGVREIVMVSPPGPDGSIAPEVLVAAEECGVTELYRVGGAQAIGALAYGTETIRRVDKITGPGNAYVASAKRQVFGRVGIDMIAGPTEVVIVADDRAPVSFVAADVIAQAEHDEQASPICITTSKALAENLSGELEVQLARAPRQEIARHAIERQGAILLVPSLSVAEDLVNRIAPEHLEVLVRNPAAFARRIRHAGSIFLGPWSMEALGDYAAGPNHTLPTSGTARFSSPLGVHDFVKFSNLIQFSRPASHKLAPTVELLALAEGFAGHAASAAIRRNKK
ncbi:MAG: histidinol dehydrogenase [Bacteroidota bacterium]